jgi:hypothetical protein
MAANRDEQARLVTIGPGACRRFKPGGDQQAPQWKKPSPARIETTYRAAGLLPSNSDHDDTLDEAIYVLKNIHSAQRKATAVALLKALIAEEENEEKAKR